MTSSASSTGIVHFEGYMHRNSWAPARINTTTTSSTASHTYDYYVIDSLSYIISLINANTPVHRQLLTILSSSASDTITQFIATDIYDATTITHRYNKSKSRLITGFLPKINQILIRRTYIFHHYLLKKTLFIFCLAFFTQRHVLLRTCLHLSLTTLLRL